MSDGCSSLEFPGPLCPVLHSSEDVLDAISPFGAVTAPVAKSAVAALLPFPDRRASFEIYRADEVRLTSILFSGGDWRWQFRSAHGDILAAGAGYHSEAECRAAVHALHDGAGSARIVLAE